MGAIELAIILGLTLANAFFAASEIALIAVRTTRLRDLAAEGSGSARVALELRANPERLMATVQVGITVIGATAAVFGGATLEAPLEAALRRLGLGDAAEEVAVASVVAVVSTLSVVVGELVPKSLALRNAGTFALVVARPVAALAFVARPIVWFLTAISNVLLRPFGDRTQFSETRLSPEELHQVLGDAAAAGTLDPAAAEVAQRTLDASTRAVNALMIPRQSFVVVRVGEQAQTVLARVRTAPHARYPVLGEDGEVAGYALARELYDAELAGSLDVVRLTRTAPFVPELSPTLRALRLLQRARTELAFLVDEQGLVVGLVTIEDIVEDLLGEVLAEEENTADRIHHESPLRVVVDGGIPVHEVSRAIGVDLPEDPAWSTVAGLVLAKAGRIPKPGDRVRIDDQVEAEVTEATLRQVRKVRLRLTPREPA
jgi:magnesium and cobalt exporter, CNNM family